MEEKEFKFELGDQVFILGLSGRCLVNGRAKAEFLSGGKVNFYNLDGVHPGWQAETVLLTPQEVYSISEPTS